MKKLLHRLGAYVLTAALTAGSVLAGFEGNITVYASEGTDVRLVSVGENVENELETGELSVAGAGVLAGSEQESGVYEDASMATATDAVVNITIENLKAAPKAANSIKLAWSADSRADGYTIYKYDSANSKWLNAGSTKSASFTISTFSKSATAYIMAVEAYKVVEGKKVVISEKAKVKSTTLPGKVTTVKEVGKYSTTSTYIKWSKVAGAKGYVVYRYDATKKVWTKLATTTKTTYENTKLTAGKGYAYKVKAYITYGGKNYLGEASATLKTATIPKSVSSAAYLEKEVLTLSKSGDYKLLSSDASFAYVHGYKLDITKASGATGYIIYYQDVKDRNSASATKAKKLKTTKSTSISLSRTTKKGYERVFWVSAYYTYNGKTYVNSSKTPVNYGGTQYIYRNTKSKVTSIQEEVYGAVDGQISVIRYYTAAGKLNKYQKYVYDKYGFITKINTYNAAGKLIKTEKWR